LKVPTIRKIAKQFQDLSLEQIQTLLNSEVHEHREAGLFILINKYTKANKSKKKEIFRFYLHNTKSINNWDLVDLSAPKIVGNWLLYKDKTERKILYRLAKSKSLWERRIAMLSCYAFIRAEKYEDALAIADLLITDKHDLIHKAAGWMLREIGNRDRETEEKWLRKRHKTMPRTMLRYAIEKFDEKKRKYYMKK